MVLHTTELSETKRTLLEKYLHGELSQTTTDTGPIPRRALGSPAPLSFGQQQVWLLAQLIPDIPVYNECVTIHLPGPLNIGVLEQSFNEIIRRYEVWRTSFPTVDGQPVQLVHPSSPLTLPVVDLRHLPEAQREAEALRLATKDALSPFDLAHGPLLRTTLMRLDDAEHRLFLTLHHIIFDAVTLSQVFLPELHTLYQAFANDQPSPLPEPLIQYADFAAWQRGSLPEDVLTEQLGYWKKHLADAATMLELPSDFSRPPVPSYRGSVQQFTLSKRLTEALKTLSRQEGVTLYMTLVAAFQTLLYRYSGQEDMLLGTAISDRKRSEVQRLIGYFLNTLVLRTDLSGDPSFRELLGRVREVILEALAHQDVPFEYLVKELQPERHVGQNPLFQVLLTLEPPPTMLASGWTLNLMEVKTNTAKFDLTLYFEDRPDGLVGRCEYSTDLFNAATITRMMGHWQTLLEGIVANPAQGLKALPLLTEAERQQFLGEWNATQKAYAHESCVQQLFEEQVERTPDAVAVVYEELVAPTRDATTVQQLTYRELNARANQLAHHLRGLGVGPEVLVGLCMERSLEMVVGLLGVLKAGGAYVPLDPTYPSERLTFMLEDSQVAVLVTQQHLTARLATQGMRVVCLDADAAALEQQSEENPNPRAMPDNLAYVIYTSGSSGRPKGVQVLHSAVVNFLLSMRQQPGLTDEDTLLAVTTLSFDIAALELFLPLIVGARLVVASREVVVNGAALAEALVRSRATTMQATPVTWRMLLSAGWQGNQQLKILCGGEALPLELAQQLLPKCAALWNLYGPTETTIWSTICKIEPGTEAVSIGYPIANTEIYLLDTHLQLVPIGVPGELHIGGTGLARGYLNRPELTSEHFIPHPFNDAAHARLYKTGDLARYRPDGTIELLGRLDQQVKLRGFRIELGEIETVLSQHPSVRQAVVVAREDAFGDKRLVAYIVTVQGQPLASKHLHSFLKEKLPEYMLPATFMLLEALPLTPNGKVDRRALPAPEPGKRTVEDTFVAPTLLVHYQLLRIWEELLAVRPIGMRDNFFYLGGHSLLAARLVDRIEQVFGKKLPLATLFAGPTIEQVAEALQRQTEIWSPVVAVQAGASKRPFFFLHGDYKGGAFYCFPLARDLGADQPFYALEPCSFAGLPIPPTIEAMATAHIESLQAVQPQGPYLLGGFCNGGLVVYEMARQLHAAGETVDLLVLIDATPVAYLKWMRRVIKQLGRLLQRSQETQLDWFLWLRHMYRYLQHEYRYLRSPYYRRLQTELDPELVHSNGTIPLLNALYALRISQGAERLEGEAKIESRRRRDKASFVVPRLAAIFPDALFPADEVLRHDWEGLFHWTASDYVPGFYAGKSTFFFFWDSEERGRGAQWRKVAAAKDKEVEVYIIAGTHDTCKTEHLHNLSAQLRKCLEDAQTVTL